MQDFDEDYARRVREGCFKAIIDASVLDGQVHLREREIYDGVMSAIAMIHSSQDEPPPMEKTVQLSEAIARHFRERVEELKAAKSQTPRSGATSRRSLH